MKTFVYALVAIVFGCFILGLYFCYRSNKLRRAAAASNAQSRAAQPAPATAAAAHQPHNDVVYNPVHPTAPQLAPGAMDLPPAYESLYPERK